MNSFKNKCVIDVSDDDEDYKTTSEKKKNKQIKKRLYDFIR